MTICSFNFDELNLNETGLSDNLILSQWPALDRQRVNLNTKHTIFTSVIAAGSCFATDGFCFSRPQTVRLYQRSYERKYGSCKNAKYLRSPKGEGVREKSVGEIFGRSVRWRAYWRSLSSAVVIYSGAGAAVCADWQTARRQKYPGWPLPTGHSLTDPHIPLSLSLSLHLCLMRRPR